MSEASEPIDYSKREINLSTTTDLLEIKYVLAELVKALNAGPRSRCRSLVITKLEEAGMWAHEGVIRE